MESFNLDQHLKDIYQSHQLSAGKPVIALTTNYGEDNAKLAEPYYQQVIRAGGTPVLLPPVADAGIIADWLERVDGIVLTGGADINPLWTGENPLPQLHSINRQRDLAELLLTRLAFDRQIPMLGICRGIQTLAVALGGKVAQDISTCLKPQDGDTFIKHSQDADRSEPTHGVRYVKDSVLDRLYGQREGAQAGGRIFVNSFHHQAVTEPGPHLRVIAKADDGVIEAVESSEGKQVTGVQWHPECLGADGLPVFQWLVSAAKTFSEAKGLHHRILTLDSHCDTPMFFPQGIDFAARDSRILYDLHKMHEGRTDAVTMVAYLPQPKAGQTFSDTLDLKGIATHNPALADRYMQKDADGHLSITPDHYADLIFDKITQIVDANSDRVMLARTLEDLVKGKHEGKKMIMIGIENGLALNHDLSNVAHFAQRGLVYITLCHNGDNDICDSCRGNNTHHGVSEFGEQVIHEMNAQGLLVDLSHAAEKSFYDALDISQTPIVCSHSNCKALCDVPRNLTDDQLRALAKAGGVAQVTLYHGFLRKEGEADINDALAHLDHAISVMGIDHVGLGTDFDGDGGIRGLANASELINFTVHLLQRHYSEEDIRKIWGGNWLRVMRQARQWKVDSK